MKAHSHARLVALTQYTHSFIHSPQRGNARVMPQSLRQGRRTRRTDVVTIKTTDRNTSVFSQQRGRKEMKKKSKHKNGII
jgi:hypothetical protein